MNSLQAQVKAHWLPWTRSIAVQLVPVAGEGMQRVCFLTAMKVDAFVTEGEEENPEYHDASPCLAWE